MYHLHLHFQFAKKSLAIKETLTMWSKYLSWCFVQQRDIVCQLADNDEFNWALNFFKTKCKGFAILFKCDKTLIELFFVLFLSFFLHMTHYQSNFFNLTLMTFCSCIPSLTQTLEFVGSVPSPSFLCNYIFVW